jgi:hypothetical protein
MIGLSELFEFIFKTYRADGSPLTTASATRRISAVIRGNAALIRSTFPN